MFRRRDVTGISVSCGILRKEDCDEIIKTCDKCDCLLSDLASRPRRYYSPGQWHTSEMEANHRAYSSRPHPPLSTFTFVGDVPSGGFAWSVTKGEARVDLRDGEMEFEVKGLTLAGGLITATPVQLPFVVIGSTRGVTKVNGTLVCDVTSGPPFPKAVTPDVPLSAKGDAKFSGTVSVPIGGTDPSDMAFLIRVAGVETGGPTGLIGKWIAHGAVRIP